MERFSRTVALFGEDGLAALSRSKVLLVGVGGVGGYALEALTRCGVGEITIVDGDEVALSNFNRQIIATENSLGRKKVDVAAERAYQINPSVKINAIAEFWSAEDAQNAITAEYDYVLDAIDTVTTKLAIIKRCLSLGVNIISCAGTGNKLRPELITVAKLRDTHDCPLCRVMRRELRGCGADDLEVVFSPETPIARPRTPSSAIFCPAVAGLTMANRAVLRLSTLKFN